jgi:hypothetical protein
MPGDRASRARHPGLPTRRAVRLAILLWLVFGVVLWNALFDRAIVIAGRNYLSRQSQAQRHNGPVVTIAGVMRPAAAQAAIVASCWSLAVTATGLAAIGYAASRVGSRREAARAPDLVGQEASAASQRATDPPGAGPTSTTFPS